MLQTADGNLITFRMLTVFRLGVPGIWRTIHAYIRLKPRSSTETISLIVRLPWLCLVKPTKLYLKIALQIFTQLTIPKMERRKS